MNRIWAFVLCFGVCRDHLDTTDVARTCKAWSVQQGLTGDDTSRSADGELTQLLCGAGVRPEEDSAAFAHIGSLSVGDGCSEKHTRPEQAHMLCSGCG